METEAKLPNGALWTIFVAAWSTSAIAAGFAFCGPVITLLLERMTGSGAFIGTFATVGAITTVALTPIAPWLMSRFSHITLIVFGILGAALMYPFYHIVPDPYAWFLIRFCQGLSLTIVFVVCETWINQIAPETMRGRILSVYAMFLAGGLGIGAAAAAWLIAARGLDGFLPFAIGTAIVAIGIVPILIGRFLPFEKPEAENAGLPAVAHILRTSPGLMLTGIVFGAIEYSLFHLLPVFGVRTGLSEAKAALLLMALPIGNIALQYPVGILADRFPRRRVLLSLFAFCAAAPLALLGAGFATSLVVLAAYTGVATGIYTLGLSLLSELHRGERMAAANSTFIMMYGLGSLVAPLIIGISMDAVGADGMPIVLSAIAVLGFLGFYRLGQGRRPATAPAR